MPYCPKCKSEYEMTVEVCPICTEELVEDLENHVYFVPVMEMDSEVIEDAIEFLKYSGIKDIKTEEKDDFSLIFVDEKRKKEASQLLNGYIYNLQKLKKEEELEDISDETIVDDEETLISEIKIQEMKSSASSFLILGALITIFAAMNVFKIMPMIESEFVKTLVLVVGVLLIILGNKSNKKAEVMTGKRLDQEQHISDMVSWYEDSFKLENFFEANGIDCNEYDEGALYFKAVDLMKDELRIKYPNESNGRISSAAEKIYAILINLSEEKNEHH